MTTTTSTTDHGASSARVVERSTPLAAEPLAGEQPTALVSALGRGVRPGQGAWPMAQRHTASTAANEAITATIEA